MKFKIISIHESQFHFPHHLFCIEFDYAMAHCEFVTYLEEMWKTQSEFMINLRNVEIIPVFSEKISLESV